MARTTLTNLSSITGWTGRRALRIATYPLDLGAFIADSLRSWMRRGHFRNRATRRAAIGQMLTVTIDPLPATLIVALPVGFIVSLPLVTLSTAIDQPQLAAVLLRTIGLELGPLLTAVIVIGRAGSAMTTELANMQLHGELAALERLGIDFRDFFVAPRLLAGAIAQLVLATYFTALALFGGMLLAGIAMGTSAGGLAISIIEAVTPLHLLTFIGKNLLFGLLIAAAACYSALRVTHSPVDLPFRVQHSITASLVMIFLLDGLMTAIWL